MKLCADKHSDITRIKHLLNQPAVDPNFYDEVFLEHFCWIVNPRRMHEGYGSRSVCVCVCLSVCLLTR